MCVRRSDQFADDLVDVAPAAEPFAFAADDQRADILMVRKFGEQITQVGVALERQRIQLLGTIQRYRGDAIGLAEPEVVPFLRRPLYQRRESDSRNSSRE